MKREKKNDHVRQADFALNIFVVTFFVLLMIVIIYPLAFVVASSFSSGRAISMGLVTLWPREFTLVGYETVFDYKAVWTGYANTMYYTFVGTAINVIMTTLCAYPLSRKNLQGKSLYTILFMIPMFFGGGMIPNYILMSNLHLINTRWALLLPGAINIFNMIIMRTFLQNSIPDDLLEAAKMDGITDIGYLMKIILPLSKAIYAVITLYYAVGHWNSYFDALLYVRVKELQPLQLVLRSILNASNIDLTQLTNPEQLASLVGLADVMKYALMVVSSVPILIMYPFVQKFFEKGVMIGSIKG